MIVLQTDESCMCASVYTRNSPDVVIIPLSLLKYSWPSGCAWADQFLSCSHLGIGLECPTKQRNELRTWFFGKVSVMVGPQASRAFQLLLVYTRIRIRFYFSKCGLDLRTHQFDGRNAHFRRDRMSPVSMLRSHSKDNLTVFVLSVQTR